MNAYFFTGVCLFLFRTEGELTVSGDMPNTAELVLEELGVLV